MTVSHGYVLRIEIHSRQSIEKSNPRRSRESGKDVCLVPLLVQALFTMSTLSETKR
jgi:hypothetical protein